jgi:hypothetical protein
MSLKTNFKIRLNFAAKNLPFVAASDHTLTADTVHLELIGLLIPLGYWGYFYCAIRLIWVIRLIGVVRTVRFSRVIRFIIVISVIRICDKVPLGLLGLLGLLIWSVGL